MSKYKYSRQLSSQYRKVFKAYHSFDRYQSQLKQNSSKRQFSSERYNNQKCSQKNDNVYLLRNRISTDQSDYNQTRKARNNEQLVRINKYSTAKSPLIRISKCKTQNVQQNKYFPAQTQHQNPQQMQRKNNHLDFIKRNYLHDDQIYLDKPFLQSKNATSHKTNISIKLGEINKKRNDLKALKLRTTDVKKINKRYSYLNTNQNQNQKNGEEHKLFDIYKNQQAAQLNNTQKNRNIIELCQFNKIRKPFNEVNINIVSKNSFIKNERGFLDIDKKIKTLHKQDQGIQTPHFCQNQSQNQFLPTQQPSFCKYYSNSIKNVKHKRNQSYTNNNQTYKRLQNIARNTFTDRF